MKVDPVGRNGKVESTAHAVDSTNILECKASLHCAGELHPASDRASTSFVSSGPRSFVPGAALS